MKGKVMANMNGKTWLIMIFLGLFSFFAGMGAYALGTHNQVIENRIKISTLERDVTEIKTDVKEILKEVRK